ncbi:MAG: hypothetical protein EOO53_14155 [Gammaproteobacteria bacterium]|nr:MAG: hypothetical protein EOO53_14155 [Gammaproteobacteria bacterium]
MKIYISQIYVKPGIKFYFSHFFQKLMSEELTRLAKPSELFMKKYKEDTNIVFNLSAKQNLDEVEVIGPTVFKKTNDIEYSIFLPHDGSQTKSVIDHTDALRSLFKSIILVLDELNIDSANIENQIPMLMERIISDDSMFRF